VGEPNANESAASVSRYYRRRAIQPARDDPEVMSVFLALPEFREIR